MMVFFILITCFVENILVLKWEIKTWSLHDMELKGSFKPVLTATSP